VQLREERSSVATECNEMDEAQWSAWAGSRDYFEAASNGLALLPDASDSDLPLERHYGLSGSLTTLSSEVERTFEANITDGRRLILKTCSRPQALESFRFQSATLAGLNGAVGVLTPKVIPTLSGALMFEEHGIGGYLQTRIDGVALHNVPRTPSTLYEVGVALARINLALASIRAPASQRPVLWNIACWPRLVELEQYLPEGPTADRVRAAMSGYMEFVAPYLTALNWQITHNDPSPFNLILTGGGVAFIDFGDGGWNPRVQDLAIAAGHFVTEAETRLGGAEYVIAGYASLIRLSDVEIKLLVGLIRARHGALVLINRWRARLFPADARYILKNVVRAEQGLSILAGLDASESEAAVRLAMALDRP
jgi:Ser/Thr protein kinase RdoA (MazF antagonist)